MARVQKVEVVGPLEPFQHGFESALADMGYTPRSVAHQLWLVNHLSIWLEERDLTAADLVPAAIRAFVADHRADGYIRFPTDRALVPLLNYLRALGVTASPEEPINGGRLVELMDRYRRYLLVERGLDEATIRRYMLNAESFLPSWVDASDSRLAELDAAGVVGFVTEQCARRGAVSAKNLVTSLRSLLRFLLLDGSISVDLAGVVPTVARWRGSHLPKAVTPAQAEALLASAVTLRDRAILLLLIRLGLRGGEVARLQLEDVDWRHGELVIRGKARRDERLPLPVDVGEAIVEYLKRGRPVAPTRAVFIRADAPRSAATARAVQGVVRTAARRAGLAGVSTHRLRHGAATQMLRTGSSLTEVGQVLRHRSVITTAIYAKVDRDRLQELARPWPGVAG
jgi:site-specific recombinase XerD